MENQLSSQMCPYCQHPIAEGESHSFCEEEIAKKTGPLCIYCQHPVLEGKEYVFCQKELARKVKDIEGDIEHRKYLESVTCPNCGGTPDCCVCCKFCGKLECNGDCLCYCCGSTSTPCDCHNDNPLAGEEAEHRTGNFNDLIDPRKIEVND